MVDTPVDEARPLLRAFPVEVPTGVGFMKNADLVADPSPTSSRRSRTLSGVPAGGGKRISDDPFDPSVWRPVDGFGLTDITIAAVSLDRKSPRGRGGSTGQRCATHSAPQLDGLYRVLDM